MSKRKNLRKRTILTGTKITMLAVLAALLFVEPLRTEFFSGNALQVNQTAEAGSGPENLDNSGNAQENTAGLILMPVQTPTPTPAPTPFPLDRLTPVDIEQSVKAALLMNCETETYFYEYNIEEVLYPASVTKLMTALLALENGDLTDILTVTETAVDVGDSDAVMAGFYPEDTATLETVLYGALLPSGNDAAEVIAEYMAGSVEEFAVLMNHRALELGMTSTNFCNPHGLPADEHVTTAKDISLVMQALLSQKVFFEISSQKSHQVLYLNKNLKQVAKTYQSTNRYLTGEYALPDGITLLGGKTGSTKAAGKCLALFVQSPGGKVYIAEVFGAENFDTLYASMNKLLFRILEVEENL